MKAVVFHSLAERELKEKRKISADVHPILIAAALLMLAKPLERNFLVSVSMHWSSL